MTSKAENLMKLANFHPDVGRTAVNLPLNIMARTFWNKKKSIRLRKVIKSKIAFYKKLLELSFDSLDSVFTLRLGQPLTVQILERLQKDFFSSISFTLFILALRFVLKVMFLKNVCLTIIICFEHKFCSDYGLHYKLHRMHFRAFIKQTQNSLIIPDLNRSTFRNIT